MHTNFCTFFPPQQKCSDVTLHNTFKQLCCELSQVQRCDARDFSLPGSSVHRITDICFSLNLTVLHSGSSLLGCLLWLSQGITKGMTDEETEYTHHPLNNLFILHSITYLYKWFVNDIAVLPYLCGIHSKSWNHGQYQTLYILCFFL